MSLYMIRYLTTREPFVSWSIGTHMILVYIHFTRNPNIINLVPNCHNVFVNIDSFKNESALTF